MMNKMTMNTYLSSIESIKQNKQTEQKQTHRYREHCEGYQMGGGAGEWVNKVKGLRSTNW